MSTPTQLPSISVITPAYSMDQLDELTTCIDGILDQEYPDYEIIAITEGDDLSSRVTELYDDAPPVTVVQIENPDGGLSVARNAGITHANGDVIAYIDSDACPREGWLHALGQTYADTDALAVGGRAVPAWETTRPWYLPDDFLWLVGATHTGHPEDGAEMRNALGCNISYKREVLEELDGFETSLGKDHGHNLQGEESELGARMQAAYDAGMVYAADAVIDHTVDAEQCQFSWLTKRAYLQGYSKAVMAELTAGADLATEHSYLAHLLTTAIPRTITRSVFGPQRHAQIGSLLGILLFTVLVGLGYCWGRLCER